MIRESVLQLRRLLALRWVGVTVVLNGHDGFNLGCFAWTWRRFGPLMLYREMLSAQGDPPPLSGWQFAVFLSKRGLDEFYEGVCK